MNARNALITVASVIAGGLLAALLLSPVGPSVTAKSDRLSGSQTETAFLPERFGVPATSQ